MFNLEQYKKDVSSKLEKVVRNRESKVEKDIVDLVNELISKNEPTTIKTICNELGKRPQQIHQTIRKSNVLTKTKVKGRTLVVPIQG
jgi:type II secretory pathway component PulC